MGLPSNIDLKHFSHPMDVPSDVSFNVVGVAGSTSYSYKITAVSNRGETLPSKAISITTGNTTLSGSNFNRLKWDIVPGAVSYNVYGRTAGSELFIANVLVNSYEDKGAVVTPAGAIPTVDKSGNRTIDSSLATFKSDALNSPVQPLATPANVTVVPQGATGATTYGYRITARLGMGETLASTTVNTTTGNAVLSPTNFNRVTWGKVPGAISYNIYGRTSGSEKLLKTLSDSSTTFDDDGSLTPTKQLPTVNSTGVVSIEHTPQGQINTIGVANVINSTLYTITVNGITATMTSGITATALEIVTGLKTNLDGNVSFAGKIATSLVGSTLVLTALNKDVSFTVTVDANLTNTNTQVHKSPGLSDRENKELNQYLNRELIRNDDQGTDAVIRSLRQPLLLVK